MGISLALPLVSSSAVDLGVPALAASDDPTRGAATGRRAVGADAAGRAFVGASPETRRL